MKWTLLLLPVFCLLTDHLYAQPPVPPSALRLNATALLFRAYGLQYEHGTGISKAAQFSVLYLDGGQSIYGYKMNGWQTTLDYKFYAKGNAVGRTYFAPYARFQDIYFEMTENNTYIHKRHRRLGTGFIFGRNFSPASGNGLTIDAYFGLNIMPDNFDLLSPSRLPTTGMPRPLPPTLVGMGFRLGITVGVQWGN